jgi:tetratricopeptide (TPR) repeat protein
MSLIASVGLLLALWTGQSDERPAFAREGDRVEQEFVAYRDRLAALFGSLRGLVDQQSPGTTAALPRLQVQDAPPPTAARYGFGVLPRIVDAAPGGPQVSVFSYSWPIVDGYIAGELIKLDQAQAAFEEAQTAAPDDKTRLISNLILEYRKLLTNQRTIDQYIQYNQFWQRSIAQDRARFDQLTRVYELLKSDEPDTAQAIQAVLGKPDIPSFIAFDRSMPGRVIVRVPVYTDVDDQEFLAKATSAIEDMWQASDGDTSYLLKIELKQVTPVLQRGDRIDVRAHAADFPEDGAVLTTGAQTTHSLVGRYVALAPGDLSVRTLAHEFGHVLGFRDGYIRGYRDLGEHGFEILELTSVFDDIMSAPREGHVQPAHFKLLLDGAPRK